MNVWKFTLIFLALKSFGIMASEKCSKSEAMYSVEKICSLIEKKGEKARSDIVKYRYCGFNYVWVQDSQVKMVVHPIKPRLNNKDLKSHKDKVGTPLFVEFDKMAKKKTDGGWVEYYWAKPGRNEPTKKESFVKLCPGPLKWIAGSGIWKH